MSAFGGKADMAFAPHMSGPKADMGPSLTEPLLSRYDALS